MQKYAAPPADLERDVLMLLKQWSILIHFNRKRCGGLGDKKVLNFIVVYDTLYSYMWLLYTSSKGSIIRSAYGIVVQWNPCLNRWQQDVKLQTGWWEEWSQRQGAAFTVVPMGYSSRMYYKGNCKVLELVKCHLTNNIQWELLFHFDSVNRQTRFRQLNN